MLFGAVILLVLFPYDALITVVQLVVVYRLIVKEKKTIVFVGTALFGLLIDNEIYLTLYSPGKFAPQRFQQFFGFFLRFLW